MRLILVTGTKDNEDRRKIGDYDNITDCMMTIDNYLTVYKYNNQIKYIKEEVMPFTLNHRLRISFDFKGKWFYIEGYTKSQYKQWKNK